MAESLSFRDFTGWEFTSRPEYQPKPGEIIERSCFSQETPDSDIFPSWTGVTFLRCNLDNVLVPAGCTVIDCSTRRFKIQNDLRDWEVDSHGDPIRVLNEALEVKLGRSVDPADIPAEFIRRELIALDDFNAQVRSGEILKRFTEVPEITATEIRKTEKGAVTYATIEGPGRFTIGNTAGALVLNSVDDVAKVGG